MRSDGLCTLAGRRKAYLFAVNVGEPVLTSIPLHLTFIRKRKAQQKDHFAQVVRLVKGPNYGTADGSTASVRAVTAFTNEFIATIH